jgi:hypothetical protein
VYYYQTVYIAELTDTYNRIRESFAEIDGVPVEPALIPTCRIMTEGRRVFITVEYENNKDNLLLNTISNTVDNISAPTDQAVNSGSKQSL